MEGVFCTGSKKEQQSAVPFKYTRNTIYKISKIKVEVILFRLYDRDHEHLFKNFIRSGQIRFHQKDTAPGHNK